MVKSLHRVTATVFSLLCALFLLALSAGPATAEIRTVVVGGQIGSVFYGTPGSVTYPVTVTIVSNSSNVGTQVNVPTGTTWAWVGQAPPANFNTNNGTTYSYTLQVTTSASTWGASNVQVILSEKIQGSPVDHSGNSTFSVDQGTPSVSTWPTASAITYGQTLAASNLTDGVATPSGTFAFSSPSTAPAVGTNQQDVIFTPTDNTHYKTVSGKVSVTVNGAATTVNTWPTASAITYGQTLSSSSLSGGSASVPGTFAFSNPSTAPAAGTNTQGVTFTPTDSNYSPVNGSVSVQVNKATPSVSSWPTASDITFGQTLSSSTLTGGSGSVPGGFAFSSPGTAPAAGTSAQGVTFTPTDASNYTTVSGSVDVTVNKAIPTVTAWPTAAAITYGQTLAASTLSGGSASVSGGFAFTTPTTAPSAGTGQQSVTFTPADTTNYQTVSQNVSVTVNKATPSVTSWPAASAISYGQTLASTTLSGGAASVAGGFAFTAPGTAPAAGTAQQSVTFTPGDSTNYTTVVGSISVTVNKATPSVTSWPTASAITYGQTLSSSTLSGGTASVAGGFAFTAPTTAPSAGSALQDVTFTPTDAANYESVTGSVSVSVSKATPGVTAWPTASAITYGDTLASSTLTGGAASVAGGFAFTSPTTAPSAGSALQSVTFTPTDTANYTTVSNDVTVTVDKATPSVLSWPTAAGITYGQTLGASTLSGGSASVGGTFAFTAPTTAPSAGTSSQGVTFTPSDSSNFNSVAGTVEVAVSKATPTVTAWPSASGITFGQPLSASVLGGGTASVTGGFAFANPATTPPAGTFGAGVVFTPSDNANYNTVAGTVNIAVAKADPTVTTWPTASAITYGSTLASSTLSGGAATPSGTFAFTTPTTAPSAGTSSQSVTFTPNDTANFNTTAGAVSVTVNKATPAVTTWPTATAISFGQPLSASTLNGGSATVAGTFAFNSPTTVPPTGTYVAVVTFTPSDSTDYNTVGGTVNVPVGLAAQAQVNVSAPASAVYGQIGLFASAFGGSGSGSYSYSAGSSTACSVDASTGALTISSGSGTCAVTAVRAGDSQYSDSDPSSPATITIGKAPQSITFSALAPVTYGAADFGPGAIGGGGSAAVTYTSSDPTVATITSGGLIHIVGAGSTSITALQAADANYAGAAPVSQTLVVAPAVITVTADNKERAFGVDNPTFTASYSGFAYGDSAAVLSGAPTFSTNADINSPVGSYRIIPAIGTLSAANYTFAFAEGTLAVGIASQTITFNPIPAKAYGDGAFDLSYTPGASGEEVVFTSSDTSVATVSGSRVTIVGAGSTTITANQNGNTNYASAVAQQALAVAKAPLTVTADSLSRSYHVANPTLTYQFSGFVNSEGTGVLAGTPDISTTATVDSAVGSYPITITQGTLASNNYSFIFVNGTLAVGQATQSITWAAFGSSIVYGAQPFETSATGGGSGNPVTFTSSDPAVASVSGTTITVVGAGTTTITAHQDGNDNYAAASAQQQLNVGKAPLTVTAADASRAYNSADPTFAVNYAGFVNGDTSASLAGAPALATSATLASPVGTYPITVANGNLFSNNYAFTFVNGTLTVTQAAPAVTWNNPGDIYLGTALSDAQLNASSPVAGSFAYAPAAGTVLPLGTQTLTATFTPTDGTNYAQATKSVSINVVSRPVATVTLSDLNYIYDGNGKAATVTTTPAGLAVTVTYNGSTTLPVNAGDYPISVTVNDPVYVGSASGTLSIAKAAASVSLSGMSTIYNGSPQSATVTTTPANRTVYVTYNGSPTAPAGAGTYAVVATVTDPNYVGSASGSFVIAKATATVTLSGLNQIYDGTAKSAGATTVPAGRPLSFTYDGSATAPTNAGSYAVVATVNDPNYVGSANGTLVIAKATATVTVGSLNQTYDGLAKTATATTLPANRPVSFTYDGSATAPANAGSYAVVATVNDPNYVGSGNGTLVIAKATATVTLGGLSQGYDGTAKSVTATTNPADKVVTITYNGSTTAPSAAGSYAVVATVVDANYQGTASGTLIIGQSSGTVTLGSLSHTYDGTAKSATATTTPAGLSVAFTYNGSATAPTNAGSYTVVATISDANYQGSATGTMNIAKASATVTLGSLAWTYDGSAKSATATTNPAGLAVSFTYNGSASAPSAAGSYAVVASVTDANYQGSAAGTMTITVPAPVTGACGSANGTVVTVAPSSNLCTSGSASAVSGSGPWTWSCLGSNGGTTATCSAAKYDPVTPVVTAAPPTGNISLAKQGTSFTVYRTEGGSTFSTVLGTTTNTTYTDTSALKPNTIYQYAVTSDTDPTQTVFMTIRTPLYNGWNIIAVPYATQGVNPATFFGTTVSAIYLWVPTGATAEGSEDVLGSYVQVSSLVPGNGYFVKALNSSTLLTYAGSPGPATATVTLKPGWTMIANPQTANKTDIGNNWQIDGSPLGGAILSGKIGGSIYWWNGTTYDSYSVVIDNPVVEPWKGYWILNLDTVDHTLTIQ